MNQIMEQLGLRASLCYKQAECCIYATIVMNRDPTNAQRKKSLLQTQSITFL